MKKHIVMNLAFLALVDAAFLWPAPNLEIVGWALFFQLFALVTGWQCGKWQKLIGVEVNLKWSESLFDLVRHMQIHAGYPKCGYKQMTTEQKALFDTINSSDREDG